MHTLEHLLHDQLKDLYSAEKQLTKALPRMAKGASTPELKKAIEAHLRETEKHIQRLDEIAEHVAISLRGKKCKGMEGLIEEGKEVLGEEGDESVLDAGIIAAAQKIEHYEISAYGSARALAEHLGLSEVVQLLQTSLDEESAADEKLTSISEEIVLPAGPTGDEDEEAEAEDQDDEKEEADEDEGGAEMSRATPRRRTSGAR